MKRTALALAVLVLALVSIACSSAFSRREEDRPYNLDGNKKISLLRKDFPVCGDRWFRQIEGMDERKRDWLSYDKVKVYLVSVKDVTVQVTSAPPYTPCEMFLEKDIDRATTRKNVVVTLAKGVTKTFEWFGGLVTELFANDREEFFVRERLFSGDIKDSMVVKGDMIVKGQR